WFSGTAYSDRSGTMTEGAEHPGHEELRQAINRLLELLVARGAVATWMMEIVCEQLAEEIEGFLSSQAAIILQQVLHVSEEASAGEQRENELVPGALMQLEERMLEGFERLEAMLWTLVADQIVNDDFAEVAEALRKGDLEIAIRALMRVNPGEDAGGAA